MDEIIPGQDIIPGQQEAGLLHVVEGEVFAVSECCLAPATNVLTPVDNAPEGADWQSSHFVCSECGNECRIETDARVVALKRELAEEKAKHDG